MKTSCVRANVAIVALAIAAMALVEVVACGSSDSVAKKALGATCAASSECTTGKCIDQVCCNTTCDGGCERCDYQPNVGSCTAVPSGQDPDSDCADQGAATCGTNGLCNGNRGCSYYSAAYVCVAGTCDGTILRAARYCDGVGACAQPVDAGTECSPYACDNTTGCATSCTPDAGSTGCAPTFTCVAADGGGACQ